MIKTGERCSYQMAQVSHGDRKRKARLVKMVATTSSGKQRMKEVQKMEWIGLDLGLRLEFSKISRNVLARPVMGTIFSSKIQVGVELLPLGNSRNSRWRPT